MYLTVIEFYFPKHRKFYSILLFAVLTSVYNCVPSNITPIFFSIGGVTERPCPYKCVSDRYHMPNCYTTLEELVYTFGGPWWFCFILLGLLILLALVLSVARMKYAAGDELPSVVPPQRQSRIDHSFPFLESLNEVRCFPNSSLYFISCQVKSSPLFFTF